MYDHTTGMFNAQQAPYWEEGTSYNVGDMCTILSLLVKCKTAHTSTWFFEEEYWEPVINYLEVVGNGTDAEHLSNARVLDLLGNERLKGTLYIGCDADSTGGTEVALKVNATQQAAGLMSAADKIKLDALDNNFSSKADKVTAATNGNFAGLDATGNLIDSGHKHSDYLTQHQDISGKADKAIGAINGNFAALDSNGNLTDSGHKHNDYLTQHQDISGKVNGPAISTDGHIAVFDGATGKTIKDSGYTIATSVPANAVFTDTTYSAATSIADGLMSATDKSKLDSIAQGATANLGTVTRIASGTGLTGGPITSSGTLKANLRSETGLTGDSVAAAETTGRIYPIVVDNSGYLAVVVPWTNTTYSAATQSEAGLMSAADKTKLDGLNLKSSNSLLNSAGAIEEYSNRIFAVVPDANGKLAVVVPYTNYSAGAGITETVYNEGTYYNSSLNYTYYTQGYTVFTLNLISNTPYSNAAQDATEVSNRIYGIKLDANNKLSVNVPWTDTTYSNATTSAAGLMSAADKIKLDGIAAGATSGTYSNLAAAQNGTDVSLVTTGEKYIWNNKANSENPEFTGYYTIHNNNYDISNNIMNVWDSSVTYAVGTVVYQERTISAGITILNWYKCLEANTNSSPFDNSSKWKSLGRQYIELIGNGTDSNNTSNARMLDWNGNEYLNGDLYINCNADSSGGTSITSLLSIKAPTANPVFTGSISMGRKANTTIGTNSLVIGSNNTATSTYSVAMGYNTEAKGSYAVAIGQSTRATDRASFAIGFGTSATGTASNAEGTSTTASGDSSHSEGSATEAKGGASHAEGAYTSAYAAYSHVEGFHTVARYRYGRVSGKYNATEAVSNWTANTAYTAGDQCRYNNVIYECTTSHTSDSSFDIVNWMQSSKYLEIVGNGTVLVDSNARALDENGNEYLKGNLYVGCNADSSGGKKVMANGDSSITIGSITITESQLQQLLAMLT